ncbi:MAG TPA: methyltransferase domain-containing protein [Chitinophagales bacterium]|nr:methyltransferase domain-containing protein [Chitinophagales bacterium]
MLSIKNLLAKFNSSGRLKPAHVKDYYEKWTERYIRTFGDTFQSFRTTNLEELFNYFIANSEMKDGEKVLDAGCGVCGPAIYFARKMNVHVEAVTISERQCRYGRENIKKAENELKGTIRVRQGDFHKLEKLYPKETFDLIYFLESLTHSTDIARVLKSCKKVLKKGGRIYIKDLYHSKSDDAHTQWRIDYAVTNVDREFALKVEKIENFKEILSQSGFQIDFCRVLQITPDYSIGNKFVADNGIIIFDNQTGPYDGIGLTYLDYYETRLVNA